MLRTNSESEHEATPADTQQSHTPSSKQWLVGGFWQPEQGAVVHRPRWQCHLSPKLTLHDRSQVSHAQAGPAQISARATTNGSGSVNTISHGAHRLQCGGPCGGHRTSPIDDDHRLANTRMMSPMINGTLSRNSRSEMATQQQAINEQSQ